MFREILISVIIPVFNAEIYLSHCLNSIHQQDFKDFEVLIVNDGSTDSSLTIVQHYVEKDSRFVVHEQLNQGVSAARNNALSKASGDFIVFVDADDWLEAEYLSTLLNTMTDNEADLVCCGYYDYSIYATRLPINDFKGKTTVLKTDEMMYALLNGTAGVPWAKLYRKAIIDKFGIRFNNQVKMSEDLVFNLEYVSCCENIIINKYHGYNYNRLHSTSVSSKVNPDYLSSYEISNELMILLWRKIKLEDLKLINYINQRLRVFIVTVCGNIATNKNTAVFKRIEQIRFFLEVNLPKKYIKQFKNEKEIPLWFLMNRFYYCSFFYFMIKNKFSELKLKIKK
ncbi:glycosyltransferase [Flavobacterium sp. FZUC8N2.13]|uniref:Glycosyltransferase n=1 Tax=Flavobacterium zubiriense TaxID=3138075 RepID=A0ABV4TAD5_9FLAO